jgi:cytochrome c oxidase subunit 2
MSKTSLDSPDRNWWNAPVGLDEIIWITIAFIWGIFMTFMMVYWYYAGEQNQTGESFRISADAFEAKMEQMIEKYQVGEQHGFPVVAVPEGGDVYIQANQFSFPVIPKLKVGKTYRFHLNSADVNHGFSIQPVNINLQLVPGYDYVLKLTPKSTGDFHIVCNEFCGIGHHEMLGKIIVTD